MTSAVAGAIQAVEAAEPPDARRAELDTPKPRQPVSEPAPRAAAVGRPPEVCEAPRPLCLDDPAVTRIDEIDGERRPDAARVAAEGRAPPRLSSVGSARDHPSGDAVIRDGPTVARVDEHRVVDRAEVRRR